MRTLGIETSCDETAIGVVEDGTRLITSIVSSQVELHAEYGGVVPELASRKHVEAMIPVLDEALSAAGCGLAGLDAVAVTYGPGLSGALLVGLNFAKALAFSLGLPLVPVNHLEGHIYAAWLKGDPADPQSPTDPQGPKARASPRSCSSSLAATATSS
jgi:N6-L-threonylcarbamoyladenine synthase